MCGIMGASLSKNERVDVRLLTRHLLLGIENRGMHATGVAFYENGEAYVQKAPKRASLFVNEIEMDASVRTLIGHTRFGTQGSEKNNANNHPIDVGGTIGIHNGVIWNDDLLFEMVGPEKRIAQVDSEAIFALIQHAGLPVTDLLPMVKGSAAIAWLDTEGDADVLHLARISSSPVIVGQTRGGSFLFASTREALLKGVHAGGMDLVRPPYALDEGDYLQVRDGKIISGQRFDVEARSMSSLTATERKALNLA